VRKCPLLFDIPLTAAPSASADQAPQKRVVLQELSGKVRQRAAVVTVRPQTSRRYELKSS
jgi:hypothetical protein